MERVVFDRMAELDQDHWWFLARRRILDAVIRRIVRPGKDARVLEVGCGTGHNLAMLARYGKLEACELDKCARALASKRLGRQVRIARLPDLTMFQRNGYDLIALLDVLEHVPDDLASLRAIHMRLKPGGALLLTVPAHKWMWSAHDKAHHHYRRYTKKELKELFLRSGLEVQLLSYFNTLLFPPIALARIMGKITGKDSADDRLPGEWINAVLNRIFGFEAALIGRLPMPFGVSLIAVVRRPA
ncbi:MAG TPA: class I SAM-dependent methyltransferase [Sphingomicrobium sp.]